MEKNPVFLEKNSVWIPRNRCNLQVSRWGPAIRWTERVCDLPVPWHCRAWCQFISFKAAMALRPCVQQRNLEDSSVARRAQAKVPVRPGAPGEVSRTKKHRIFSRISREKSGENGAVSLSTKHILAMINNCELIPWLAIF